MGQYDWYVEADVYITDYADRTVFNINTYFVNNGWNYSMYMRGRTDLQIAGQGEQIYWVMDRENVDTRGVSQWGGRVWLGRYFYTVWKTHSAQTVYCWGGVVADGGYADGDKWSSRQDFTVSALASHTVTYNANSGSGAPSNQTKWYGSILTLSSTVPTRIGYEFVKWNTASDGSGTSYSPGDKYGLDENVTLYAIWKQTTFTVAYNANGGTNAPASQSKTYGTNLTLTSSVPSRTGYTFSKWNTAANGSGTNYNSGATYSTEADVTLYAQWTINTYTVSFDANGGSGAPSNQTKTYGVDLTLSSTTPTRNTYIFQGWGLSSDTTTVTYPSGGTYTDNKAIILYAVWKLDYRQPTVTIDAVYRVNSSNVAADDGTRGKVVINYSAYTTSSGTAYANNKVSTITVYYKNVTASSWTTLDTTTVNAASGTLTKYIPNVGTEDQYDVKVVATDSLGPSGSNSTTVTSYISKAFFTMDFLAGGHGIAFGGPSQQEGFVCNMETNFTNRLKINGYDVVPPNGYIGQVLAKKSNTSNDVEWVTEIIGGRNYLLNSNVEKNETRASSNVFTIYDVTDAFRALKDDDNTFVLSFDAKVDSDVSVLLDAYIRTSSSMASDPTSWGISPGTTWSRTSKVITRKSSFSNNDIVYVYIRAYSGTGKFYVRNVKLEKSNKPTDWTPAPEDIISVPTGGSKGQVLTKNSATDGDILWSTSVPVGTITMFGGSSAPSGWLLCQGQAVSRTTYSALFSAIGTTYGTGDGSTTFNIPNLQGKFALGKSSSYSLGSTGGDSTVTLTTDQIPSHQHHVYANDWTPLTWSYGEYQGTGGGRWGPWWGDGFSGTGVAQTTWIGGGQSHNNMPPYQTVNYIIKA